jgi:cephalosporin hydroxylase
MGREEAPVTNPVEEFKRERRERIEGYRNDAALKSGARSFLLESLRAKYSYNFTWLGRPIIQYPQDIVALQEIIWAVKPDCILEIGIAHGGSLIVSASMLELLGGNGRVVGVDIDIRAHNRAEIERHPLFKRITMIEGSSVDAGIAERVKAEVHKHARVMVTLDSNHTHAHVLRELEFYAPLVSVGSYCVVFDGIVEDVPAEFYADREWGPGNNPKTAVREYLKSHPEFEVDEEIERKLQVTAAPSGYLKRVG